MNVPTITDIESSPGFQSLDPVDQDLILKGYFNEKEKAATKEVEYNNILKERADRQRSALERIYKSSFPTDTQIDWEKAKKNPVLKTRIDELDNLYGELDYNVNQSKQEIQAVSGDDMQDKNRKFVIKPYKYRGTQGYSIVYPDGETESVPHMENTSQLTEFIKRFRGEKFNGEREGVFDRNNPLADTEMDSVFDKIRHTAPSISGALEGNGLVGDFRKRYSGVMQGIHLQNVESITGALNRYKEAENTINQLGPVIETLKKKKDQFPSRFLDQTRLTEAELEFAKAQAVIAKRNVNEQVKDPDSDLNKYYEAQNTIDVLDRDIAALKKKQDQFPQKFTEGMDLSRLQREREEAQKSMEDMNMDVDLSRISEQLLNPISDGSSLSPLEAEPQLTEANRRLAKEVVESAKIKGSRVAEDVNDYIAYEARNGMGEDASFFDFFTKNPAKIAPYVLSMTAGTLPDMINITGTALAAGAVGGAKAASSAAAAAGFATEYSASLLSDIQIRAAKEGVKLTDADKIEEYLSDPEFMQKVKVKAARRAGVIGAADSVLGGMAHHIVDSVKGAFRKVALTSAVGHATEGLGELGAQAVAEPKVSWREVANETIGLGAVSVPSAAISMAGIGMNNARIQQAKERARVSISPDGGTAPVVTPPAPPPAPDPVSPTSPPPDGNPPSQPVPPTPPTPPTPPAFTPDTVDDTQLTEPKTPTERIKEEVKEEVQQETKDEGEPIADVRDEPVKTFKDKISFINRALNWWNKRDPDVSPEEHEAEKIRRATEIFQDDLWRSVYDVLAEKSGGSFNRIMRELKESEPDQGNVGRLMDAVGLKVDEAGKKIVTNILGNYWERSADRNKDDSHVERGLLLSVALSKVINEMTGVDNYNQMSMEELQNMTPETHALVSVAQDGPIEGGYPLQSQLYSEMTTEEANERYDLARKNAQVVRDVPVDLSLDNKYEESKRLDREGVKPEKFSDYKGKTAEEIAAELMKKYKGKFIIKSAAGWAGKGIRQSVYDTGNPLPLHHNVEQIQEIIDQHGFDDAYIEPLVDVPNRVQGEPANFNEYRVHAYVDANGKAHAFRNLTYNKVRSMFEQRRRMDRATGMINAEEQNNEDTMFTIPDSPNDPIVKALQAHVEKQMSGKDAFKNQIFGVDIAMVSKEGKVQPMIFETNPMTYGMSGWLGESLSMSEIMAEMTGRPSVLAGLYEISKLGMSREQLNAISAAVSERINHPYKDNVRYAEVSEQGAKIYNPYLDESVWMQAMRSAFGAPIEFLKQLYDAIRSVFQKTVNIRFAESQGVQFPKSFRTKYDTTPVQGSKLRDYIQKIIRSPQLTESQKQVLNFISGNANDTFLDHVSVKKGKSSRYDLNKSTIYLREGAPLDEAIHEIVHSVTSDFLSYHSKLIQTLNDTDPMDQDNYTEMMAYYNAVHPDNYEKMIENGVSPDYLDAVRTYLSLLENLGITKESIEETGVAPLGSEGKSYAYQKEHSDTIPYGAISIDEMMSETISSKSFQKELSGMKAVFTNSKNLLDEIFRVISRIIRIPVNKDGMLAEAMNVTLKAIASKDNYYFTDLQVGGVLNTDRLSPSTVKDVEGTPMREAEVSKTTKELASKPMSEPKKESVALIAEKERKLTRFKLLKKRHPRLLRAFDYDGTNLQEARDIVVSYLNPEIQNKEFDDDGNKVTKKKKEWAARLVEAKVLAVEYLNNMLVDPAIPDNHQKYLSDAMEYVLNETADPINLTTREIMYYYNVLDSLSDGGPPTGFRHILPKRFIEEQGKALQFVYKDAKTKKGKTKYGLNFTRPMGEWRRGPFLGLFQGEMGSLASWASEVNFMAPTQAAKRFLSKFLGVYKDNINEQELEVQTLTADYVNYRKTQFPAGMGAMNRYRVGLVARLTQYSKSRPDPKQQIITRFSQLTESLDSMETFDKTRADLTRKAITDIIGTTDLDTLPDEAAIINFLESKLAPTERNMLQKTREIGRLYLPALKSVKALTRGGKLEEYVNYVHDSNITRGNPGEKSLIRVFNDMGDVLQQREGINPDVKAIYPDLDIVAVTDDQIQSSSYEKYTGLERFFLNQALSEKSPIPKMLDLNTDASHPITDRLKSLVATYHMAKTRSQPGMGGLMGFAHSLMAAILAHKIIGFNAWVKNMVSSSIQRAGLASLSNEAVGDMFIYDIHTSRIKNWIQSNFPVQYNRTNEYDNLTAQEAARNVRNTYKARREIGDGVLAAVARSVPGVPKAILDTYSNAILNTASKLSNSLPERRNAFAMFTSAYIHYAKLNGTVTNSTDFLARLPVDKNAATQASDFVSRSLGYAPDKASKGSFWNGSAISKQFLSRTFLVFRQQSVGIALEFQNMSNHVKHLTMAGQIDEARKASIMAASLLTNSMMFRALSLAISQMMIWGGLGMYFNSKDDEEKKRKLLEEEQKYARAATRNNIRDFATEQALTMIPITSMASTAETAMAWYADSQGLLAEDTGGGSIEIKNKDEIQAHIREIEERIKELNARIKVRNKPGMDTTDLDEEIEKLEELRSQLTEQSKFRYFPNKPEKAYLSALGGYGIAAQEAMDRIKGFTEDDLTDPEKVELQNLMDQEFAYNDTLAGEGFAADLLKKPLDFTSNMFQSNLRKEDRLPTALWLKSLAKIGMNPGPVVERARREMAQETLKERKAQQKRIDRIRLRFMGKKPNE